MIKCLKVDVAMHRIKMISIVAYLVSATLLGQSAHAGSRGLNVVFINVGNRDIYEDEFYKSYIDNKMKNRKKMESCWERLVQNGVESYKFEWISRKRRPEGLDYDIGKRIWQGDILAAEKARKVLKKDFEYAPGDFIGNDGFDGMYLFDSDGKSLTMMSVGARGGKSEKMAIKIDNEHPEQTATEFSYAMCKIGAPLMIGFGV